MDLRAVTDDPFEIVVRIVAQNLVNLAVVEGRMQPSGDALGTAGRVILDRGGGFRVEAP